MPTPRRRGEVSIRHGDAASQQSAYGPVVVRMKQRTAKQALQVLAQVGGFLLRN
jgi:hypothetical protein